MTLRTEDLPDNPNRVAVLRGPMVLAGELGEVNHPAVQQPDFVPVLPTEGRPPGAWLKL